VTRSEFFLAVTDQFGDAQGRALLRDLVIDALDHRTSSESLEDGVAPRDVWFALCEAMRVPQHQWHGVGLRAPTGDTPT
jgi:hypothetical protein